MQDRKLEVEIDLDQPLLDGLSSIAATLETTTPLLIERLLTAFVHASKTDPELAPHFLQKDRPKGH